MKNYRIYTYNRFWENSATFHNWETKSQAGELYDTLRHNAYLDKLFVKNNVLYAKCSAEIIRKKNKRREFQTRVTVAKWLVS